MQIRLEPRVKQLVALIVQVKQLVRNFGLYSILGAMPPTVRSFRRV
jgi:hypothetical protein